MATPGAAAHERLLLCDLFDDLGPDAPTLCEGWATAHLAAHLLVRDRRPDALPGLVAGGFLERWTHKVEEGAREKDPYPVVVRRLRSGPPRWAPTAWPGLADRGNVHELFVHHEDVRRANGLGPRPDSAEQERLDAAVWDVLGVWGPRLTRSVEVGVVLCAPDGRRRTARKGERRVELHGRPTEIMLALFGRGAVADVEVVGDDDARVTWSEAKLGL